MKTIELVIPRMGEGIIEVNIIKWLKKEGETFNIEEPIVEIATDKVDSEIPAPYSGKIKKLLVKAGDNVSVGKPIAILKLNTTSNIDDYNLNCDDSINKPSLSKNTFSIDEINEERSIS